MVVVFQILTTVVHRAYYLGANTVLYYGPYIIRVPLLHGPRGGIGCMRVTYDVYVPSYHNSTKIEYSDLARC